jgi:hypothetical protein
VLVRLGHVAACACGQTSTAGDVPVLDALGHVLQQALSTLRPSRGHRPGGQEVVVADERQRDARRTLPILPGKVGVEGTLTRLDAPFGGPRPRRRLADQLEVGRRELRRFRRDE